MTKGLPRELKCDGQQISIHVTTVHFPKVVDDLYLVMIKDMFQLSLKQYRQR